MIRIFLPAALAGLLCACASESALDPLQQYAELDAVTILDAPPVGSVGKSAALRDRTTRGKYLVELLGCGSCHTDGALIGEPNEARLLAGSSVGIAYENPLGTERPGIVFPSNITPDLETGIGDLSDTQVAAAIRGGRGRHGAGQLAVMPWQGYARLTDQDLEAIVAYLRSIEAVSHQVPDRVAPGAVARAPFVYFGVYRRR